MVITFDSSNMAVNAYEMLKNQTHEEKKLLCNNQHPHTSDHPLDDADLDAVSDDNVDAEELNIAVMLMLMLMLMLKP